MNDEQAYSWSEAIKELDKPLDRKHVAQRQEGYGDRKITLSYVEGWHAIAEANRIFGHDGWTRETLVMDLVSETEKDEKIGATYYAKVRVTCLGVSREGCGAGHGISKSRGKAHEGAIKEAETDAFKRAIMTFGWPLGLALYDKKQEHVD